MDNENEVEPNICAKPKRNRAPNKIRPQGKAHLNAPLGSSARVHEKISRERGMWEMRTRGKSIADIAEEFSCSYTTVSLTLKRAAVEHKELIAEDIQAHLNQSIARLDKMVDSIYDNALQGDPRAIQCLLNIEERRAKLLGLDATIRTALDITTGGEPVTFDVVLPRVDKIAAPDA